MKITDYIRNIFSRDNHVITYKRGGFIPDLNITCHQFGETVYLNIVEILTSIYTEVVWSSKTDKPSAKYLAWKKFVDRNGQRILTQILDRAEGFCVIGYDSELNEYTQQEEWRFYELPSAAYRVVSDVNEVRVECTNSAQRFYVLKSPSIEAVGRSERMLCDGAIKMTDAVLNGATTTAERLGAYVVMTPTSDVYTGELLEDEKKELEKELQREYGMLNKQKQIMVLPRPMSSQVVSLASIDTKMTDKLRAAVLIMADRLNVPCNQIALIDGGQSKAFANGTEYREGDVAKYRSFRRLLNCTFYDMAVELGMRVDYTIENEPLTTQGQTIENNE